MTCCCATCAPTIPRQSSVTLPVRRTHTASGLSIKLKPSGRVMIDVTPSGIAPIGCTTKIEMNCVATAHIANATANTIHFMLASISEFHEARNVSFLPHGRLLRSHDIYYIINPLDHPAPSYMQSRDSDRFAAAQHLFCRFLTRSSILLPRPACGERVGVRGCVQKAHALQVISPFQECQDRFQYAHSILEHLRIGEPDDAVALRG